VKGLNFKQLQNKIKSFVSQINVNFDQCFRCGACSGICPVKKVLEIFDPALLNT
jgi:heterodisulfide reductase subunit C